MSRILKDVGRAALLSGTLAGITSTAALVVLARTEGKGAWQPTNATSHWLHGEQAAAVRSADLAHTGIGWATNHAASVFWAACFQGWLAWRGRSSPAVVVRDAFVVSAVAAAVDYGPTPKRFTPGWEFVLSKRAMALTYGAMAVGLAAGALLCRTDR